MQMYKHHCRIMLAHSSQASFLKGALPFVEAVTLPNAYDTTVPAEPE